eukprot:TRINITY_DN14704_c0_g1_i1.p1 TRINITY_DN14704_c0_g1~~TRINITY_DN14704_c0_g1_i1.p1  ORF type:complete len:519 (+),score=70.80 TRINITY_DN14704_c0_g1_i1:49-1557(+)
MAAAEAARGMAAPVPDNGACRGLGGYQVAQPVVLNSAPVAGTQGNGYGYAAPTSFPTTFVGTHRRHNSHHGATGCQASFVAQTQGTQTQELGALGIISRTRNSAPQQTLRQGLAQSCILQIPLNDQIRLVNRTADAMRKAGMPVPPTLPVVLPPESDTWSPLEIDLFIMSEGFYDPQKMVRHRKVQPPSGPGTGVDLQVRNRVSIVAPSMSSRQHYHQNLWRCFDAQTWPDKELVVVESYEEKPSIFLQAKAREDKRIVHVTMQRLPGQDFSVGLKRNMTLHLASGEFVVNFDDDDLYAAEYVETIVGEMKVRGLQAVTLSSWYNYYAGQGMCTYSDPAGWEEWAENAEELEAILYGYGFSYTHRRAPSLAHPYPNVGFAEDAPFFLKLREICGADKVVLRKDTEGMCLHIMHRANTAQVLATVVPPAQVGNLKVASLKPFQEMIDSDFFRFSPWRPPVRPPTKSNAGQDDESASITTGPARVRAHSFRNDGLWGTMAAFNG